MRVTITVYGHLRDAVGQKTLERDVPVDTSIRDVLESLAAEFSALEEYICTPDGTIDSSLVVRQNQSPVSDFEAPLRDGDTLAVTTQIVGG